MQRLGANSASRRGVQVCSGLLSLLVLVLSTSGCSTVAVTRLERLPPKANIDVEVYRRAETERASRLAKQVVHLRADLQQAEEALVMAESGLRGTHSRADAISSLAEARIQVKRAATAAPWRSDELGEARLKLNEAQRQIDDGHFGAARFFVYRAQRITDNLEAEAARVYAQPNTRFTRGRLVNLRAGPSKQDPILGVLADRTPVFPENRRAAWVLVRTASGEVGWVHSSLLQAN
jgi:SH3-like domain-containing protein